MSYAFNGSSHQIAGTLGTGYDVPLTLGCFFKIATHPVAEDSFLSIGAGGGSVVNSLALVTLGIDDRWGIRINNGGGNQQGGLTGPNFDATWAGFVMVATNSALRDGYIGTISDTWQHTLDAAFGGAILDEVIIGTNFASTADLVGNVAECAIWNTALSTADVTAFLAGQSATTISASSLIGYWPLSADNATQSNEGLDTGGDLAVQNATFDADHPTITFPGASAKKRRISLMGIG